MEQPSYPPLECSIDTTAKNELIIVEKMSNFSSKC